MDEVPKQRFFADKFGITFPLLCDTQGEICDHFGVPRPNKRPARFSYLFHKDQMIWADFQVSPKKQDEHVFEAIDDYQASLISRAE